MADLDPHDWKELERAFHDALTAGINHYQGLEEQPVWRPVPDAVENAFRGPMPRQPQSLESLVSRFQEDLLPYGNGNTHPRFFGWVHGGGNLYGALGEFCAALLNNNLGGRNHIAHKVEEQVLRWSRDLFGFPGSSSGLLTSGTSMATLIALVVARQSAVGASVKREGVQGRTSPLVGYCSSQGHSSVVKAFQMLGLGSDALRPIPVNDDYALDTSALATTIAADREAGFTPFCVIATLGSVNTGASDDFEAIHRVCEREELWLHVDAAFGGAIALVEEYRSRLKGIDAADSLAFDFHKWFQAPYAVGALLVRDRETHRATFSEPSEYLMAQAVGLDAGAPWPCDFGPELSRGFLALKVWFTFQGAGSEQLAAVVKKHCELAAYTARQTDESPDLERLAPVAMNIVCLRYVPSRLRGREETHCNELNTLNRVIVTQLALQGLAAPSTTRLNGRIAIRVAIVNHRTEQRHMDDLLAAIRAVGETIEAQFTPLLEETDKHLMAGGDERLVVDPETGLNRYGCSPAPRDEAFTFASSTATSVSSTAYATADQFRQELIHQLIAGGSDSTLADQTRQLENAVAEVFGLADLAPDVHLSPSGTDAQLDAVAAVVTERPGAWVSIVCGADETGSGTPLSVTGHHFDATTCLGKSVNRGERLRGMPVVELDRVGFRGADGHLKSPVQMDDDIESAVTAWIESGVSVMLHTMDQSKFGCWAPSAQALERLRSRWPDRLQVVVDACQARLDPPDLRHCLEQGHILLLTGSKFFTGPPFSGAVVFPAGFTKRLVEKGAPLPEGLADYRASSELGRWQPLLPQAKPSLNIGMLVRWQAALAEIRRYFRVPPVLRLNGLDRFCAETLTMMQEDPAIEPLFEPNSAWWRRTEMRGDELSCRRSIFPFLIRHPRSGYLTRERTRTLYEQLNQNLGERPELVSDDERALAARCCHIGQPVPVEGHNTSALRISMGARIISDGCYDASRTHDHLQDELMQVQTILDKIRLCIHRLSPD